MTRLDWPEYALRLAEVAAQRSEDPYVQVGACILRNNYTVAAMGYNGAPAGITIDFTNREERRPLIIHAETNALRWVNPHEGILLAVTHIPCIRCTVEAAAHGIRQIVYRNPLPKETHYEDSTPVAERLGIELRQI